MTQRSSAQERRDRVLRVVLPVIVLALSLAAWEMVVRLATFRLTCCRRRASSCKHSSPTECC